MGRLLRKVKRYLDRTQGAPPGKRARDGIGLVSEAARGLVSLRSCTTVGWGARVAGGRPDIRNLGRIDIGNRLSMQCGVAAVSMRTATTGHIDIGNSVVINFGAVIAAKTLVRVADGVSIGPYAIISDTEVCDPESDQTAQSVQIDKDVWLAARVTVMPGSRIGEGSVITAGSIVSGTIPPGVIAGGIPARVFGRLDHNNSVSAAGKSAGSAMNTRLESRADNGVAVTEVISSSIPVERASKSVVRPPPSEFGYIISDFTIAELEHALNENADAPVVDFAVAPFGQVVPSLLSPAPAQRDNLLVWTRPEGVVPAFADVLSFKTVPQSQLLGEVDAFAHLISQAAASYKSVLVPTWAVPTYVRGLGLIDARQGGVTRALTAMNLRLMEALDASKNVFVLNSQRWVEGVGKGAMNPKLWFLGKVPFHADVFAACAKEVKAVLAAVAGQMRKLLVLDLDDTLWGGIVGDQGWENLRLGGHDSLGEAFVEFQKAIKDLQSRGVVLALASKNEESVALEAIRRHPEMVLREDDFVTWRINWEDKARNIADLTAELNLGMQSVVFIDDNPVERARVREALPEVFVPEWPEDKLLYAATLRSLSCFDAPAISREDLERTKLYTSERQRTSMKVQFASLDEWLASLGIKVKYGRVDAANLARTTQLLNKTNQMNLSTRRLTETELTRWLESPSRELWVLHVSDRFGDAGLTGIVSIEHESSRTLMVDFVLSCRVMGRKVEEAMVHIAVSAAKSRGQVRVEAKYLATPKNKPCLEFWKRSGFEQVQDCTFCWPTSQTYQCPSVIALEAVT